MIILCLLYSISVQCGKKVILRYMPITSVVAGESKVRFYFLRRTATLTVLSDSYVHCRYCIMEPSSLNVQFVNETDEIVAATNGWEAARDSADSDDGADAAAAAAPTDYRGGAASSANDQHLRKVRPPPGKKTMGRVKIKMEYIKNKVRRYTTFSKRKTGIMKKVLHIASIEHPLNSCHLLCNCLLSNSMTLPGEYIGNFDYMLQHDTHVIVANAKHHMAYSVKT